MKIELNTKKNILVFIDWFWPGYMAGGPVQSILSLVNYLNEDYNFKIVTTNRDLNSSEPYPKIPANSWIKSDLNCEVYYAEPNTLSYKTIYSIIHSTEFDLVYINSFFSNHFSIIPLRILNKHYPDKPIVFAPRGMLGEGALAIKSIKKKIFIIYSKLVGLHDNVVWHATSEQEEMEIRKVIHPKNKVVCISNLPKKIYAKKIKNKIPNEIKLCFISRISFKKNLSFALEVLKEVKDFSITYNIYGPIEDIEYWNSCENIMKDLPKNIMVNYWGSVEPKNLEEVYSNEHVMFLPTFNENFGHSIVESLLCGCPVIISDQTPWNDLEKEGAGFAIALTQKQKFVDAIIHYAKLDQQQFNIESEQAINYISKKIDVNGIIAQYKTLFNDRTKN